jgi:hypothetical protein
MWPILDSNKHSAGVMILVTERTSFHQQAVAMNEELLMSGLHQHELAERIHSSAVPVRSGLMQSFARAHGSKWLNVQPNLPC